MQEGWERFWKSGSVRDYLDCCGKNVFQESAGDHLAGAYRPEGTYQAGRTEQRGSRTCPEGMYRTGRTK